MLPAYSEVSLLQYSRSVIASDRRSIARTIALGAALAVALVLGVVGQARAADHILWGAWPQMAVPDAAAFAPGGSYYQVESEVGKGMSIVNWGQPWSWGGVYQRFPLSYFESAREHGSIPMLNWGSFDLARTGPRQGKFQLQDIVAGQHDAYIRQWALDAKAWGHPLLLRFDHEMNGWWYPWGEGRQTNGAIVNGNRRGSFVKAWRHVHDIFTQVGATNVEWVWSPNWIAKNPQFPPMKSLYPGNAYVDWTGLSVYNREADHWLSPDVMMTGNGTNWLKNSYGTVAKIAPRKPMVLAEVASVEAGDGGARKAAWITDFLTHLQTHFPLVAGFVWFDWTPTQWPTLNLDSSPAALAAFRAGISSPVYVGNQFADLAGRIPAG